MDRYFSSGYVWLLIFWLMSATVYGQRGSGHFVYDFISYEIMDSSKIRADQVASFLEWLQKDLYVEFYFNREWVISLQKKQERIIKTMYNRKSKVVYRYTDGKDYKRLSIDSIQATKEKNKDLLRAMDSLKSYLQVIEFPKEKRRMHGFTCHKVRTAGVSLLFDEMWVTRFKHVPDLIFPDHLYFLIEGIPLEIIQDFEDLKCKWGVVDILPISPDDDIFKQDMSGYEVLFMETPKLIYESIHFIRTYKPKVE